MRKLLMFVTLLWFAAPGLKAQKGTPFTVAITIALENGREMRIAVDVEMPTQTAGQSLADFFEYIYSTPELDYDRILAFSGLQLNRESWTLSKIASPTPQQEAIWKNWSRNQQNP